MTGRGRRNPARLRLPFTLHPSQLSMPDRILMIEDDRQLTDMLTEYLQPLGMRVTAAGRAAEGPRRAEREAFDALALDVMLPDGDGFDVCRPVRSRSDIPILMLTARGD